MVLVYLVSCSWAFTSRRPSAKCKHILALKPNLYHAGVETWKIVNFFDIVYHRKYMMVVPKVILIFYPYFSPHLSLSFSISHFSLISASLPHSHPTLSILVSLSFLILRSELRFFFFFTWKIVNFINTLFLLFSLSSLSIFLYLSLLSHLNLPPSLSSQPLYLSLSILPHSQIGA